MSFDATYDACVLHPAGLRDLLVRLAITGLFRAHWSADILDEMVRSILRRRPDLAAAQLERTCELMCDAVPDCLTTGYEASIDGIDLPDPDDRHVLAAAIRSGSQAIVTENTADFPADVLERYDIEAQTPDVFVLRLIDLSPTTVFGVIDAQAAALRDPPFTVDQLLDRLASSGLPRSVAALRSLQPKQRRGSGRLGAIERADAEDSFDQALIRVVSQHHIGRSDDRVRVDAISEVTGRVQARENGRAARDLASASR